MRAILLAALTSALSVGTALAEPDTSVSTNKSKATQKGSPTTAATKGKALTPRLAPIAAPALAPLSLQQQDAAGSRTAAGGDATIIDCTLPLSQVGSLSVPNAVVVIRKGVVEIREAYMPGDTTALLSGTVLKLDPSGTSDGIMRKMSGLVLFSSGSMLDQLTQESALNEAQGAVKAPIDDRVFRNEGSVTGRILGIEEGNLMLADKDKVVPIALSSVTFVRSARAFIFTISGMPSSDRTRTHVKDVTFMPTSSSAALKESVVAGKKRDPLDDDLLDEPVTPVPAQMLHGGRGFGFGGRPFGDWP